MNYQKTKKKYKRNFYSIYAVRNKMVVVSSVKINSIKISDCTAVAQKKGDKCKRCSHENSSFECF